MIYLSFFDIDERVIKASEKAMELCKDKLAEIDDIQEYNQQKMIKAFQLADVRESHLWGSTGYGYDDAGRDALDKVYAYVFDAEDALVRHNFVSGTHALTVALFGVLRPGDTMLSITGMPYDTIRSAIGIEGDYPGSLKDFSIKFEMTELNPDGTLDYDKIASDIAEKKPKMVYIQRSRGYSTRPTLTWREITKAEQGFVHALVAILRPLNSVLNVFLNEGKIDLSNITIAKASTSLDIKGSDGKVASKIALTYELKKGVLTLTAKDSMNADSKLSTIKLDLNALNVGINGINGYEGAIIPLLDVLQVSNSKIKTFAQYQKDCKKAKDNVLLDVLNPLMSFVDQVLDKPFETITSVLPNLAYFIDNNGIGQLLDNLLAPITNIVKTAKSAGLDVDKIISAVLGKDLGKYLTSLLKVRGVKLNIKLADLKSCNIQDIVVPLINSLLKKTGIKLPDFKWSTIAAHGKVVTSKSHAKNAEGKFTNKEVIADKGEVLVAVLRYVADTLIKNAKPIKSLVSSIGAIKKNSMLKSIISSVFTTISMAEKDDIVRAVFYFLTGEPTNAFWDYTAYKTGSFDFSYPKGVDVDFLKNLPPMFMPKLFANSSNRLTHAFRSDVQLLQCAMATASPDGVVT